jgi:hypothetical protein
MDFHHRKFVTYEKFCVTQLLKKVTTFTGTPLRIAFPALILKHVNYVNQSENYVKFPGNRGSKFVLLKTNQVQLS